MLFCRFVCKQHQLYVRLLLYKDLINSHNQPQIKAVRYLFFPNSPHHLHVAFAAAHFQIDSSTILDRILMLSFMSCEPGKILCCPKPLACQTPCSKQWPFVEKGPWTNKSKQDLSRRSNSTGAKFWRKTELLQEKLAKMTFCLN